MATIIGTSGNDVLAGTIEADRMEGGAGNDRMNAGAGDDEIYGGLGSDILTGDAGNDRIFGEDGNDGVYGGGGNDYIDGGIGDDILIGDGGDDHILGGDGNDRIYGGTGNDLIEGGAGNDQLFGDAGDDVFVYRAGEGSDSIDGGIGNDRLELILSNADLTAELQADFAAYMAWAEGQSGVGSFTFSSLGLTITGVEDVSLVVSGQAVAMPSLLNAAPEAEAEVSHGMQEDGVLEGSIQAHDADGDELAFAMESGPSSGTIELDGETGAYVYRPAGNFSGQDTFSVRISDPSGESVVQVVTVDVAGVADQPVVAMSDVVVSLVRPVQGTRGNDVIHGDQYASMETVTLDLTAVLQDLDGSETLSVRIAGVPDRAVMSVGTRNADGTWTLQASHLAGLTMTTPTAQDFALAVTVTSEEADGDTASVSGTMQVTFDRGRYADTFVASAGNDRYDGGAGFDTIDYAESSRGVSVNLASGRASGMGSDRLTNIEGVKGSANNDRLIGNSGDNVLEGGAGNDVLSGASGDDVLSGGDGLDRLYGGAGNDMLSGGEGNDILRGDDGDDILVGGNGDDNLSGGSGSNFLDGGAGNDRLTGGTSSDVLIGGEGDDRVSAGSGNDLIVAGQGNDRYHGGSGFDTIDYSAADQGITVDTGKKSVSGMGNDRIEYIEKVIGSDFDDTFTGGNGADVFVGGDGNDWFRGMAGQDVFSGGAGNDTFVWESRDVVRGRTALGPDTITDFSAGDVLDFSAVTRGGSASSSVRVTETSDGSMLSVKVGSSFVDVVFLEDVHGVTAGSLVSDGLLIL